MIPKQQDANVRFLEARTNPCEPVTVTTNVDTLHIEALFRTSVPKYTTKKRERLSTPHKFSLISITVILASTKQRTRTRTSKLNDTMSTMVLSYQLIAPPLPHHHPRGLAPSLFHRYHGAYQSKQ